MHYDVTMCQIRVTIFVVEKQYTYVLNIMCVGLFSSLDHPERKAHAPYYTVNRGLSGYKIFLYMIS
jgi:hypothetical protein